MIPPREVMHPFDISAASSLVERTPDVAAPGVVSLDRVHLCDGATIDAGPSLVVTLPRQQWAFGLVFPLDPAALAAGGNGPIVVGLDVEVDQGHAGIMGVAEGFERLTTREAIVRPGSSAVSLSLDPSSRTAAIVVRNASEGAVRPRVTITGVGAFKPGPPRLARRSHDLGFDLFVVLAPGKTATQTVEQTLLALSPGVQVRRQHRLTDPGFIMGMSPDAPDSPLTQSLKEQVDYLEVLRSEIAAVRGLGGRVAFVTAIREPIDLAVATAFQTLEFGIPAFAELHAIGPGFVDLLITGLTAHLQRESRRASDAPESSDAWLWGGMFSPSWFFGAEFPRATGVDLLACPIDHAAGFTLLHQERQAVLMVRYEDIARGLAPGLAALTGRREVAIRVANRSDEKRYRSLYREFRARFRVPADLAARLYDEDPYVRHFYTDAEIAAFKATWVG